MATVKHSDSNGMYSWWWNSHISPKNSKWLQENLTDMDTKVKQMIKLIEEDADSFARRAEMYYKKRPELMKLVEEFYRAYRAMAERYDHATGVLRQAHRTMAEAFPNQVSLVFADESPGGSATELGSRTPETPPPLRAFTEPDELQKDAVGLSSHAIMRDGAFSEELALSRKDQKQFNDMFGSDEASNHVKLAGGKARKSLNFHDIEEKDQTLQNNGGPDLGVQVPSGSERVSKAEMEILNLKNALARLEAEKEAGLLEYQQSLERLSNLEREVSRAQEESLGLNERATQAEAEVLTLKDSLTKLEAEREANLDRYRQCLEKINNLENNISHAQNDAGELNERASKADIEVQALKQDLAKIEAEKKDALAQYDHCLETISGLERTLLNAEGAARTMTERAEKAETELATLKQVVSELTKDKEAAAFQYKQCLETISSLENNLARAQEEAQRLNSEIDDKAAKLKGAEERCCMLERTNQSLHTEFESLVQKIGDQSQELTEKQKELGRLWNSIQEERLRFMEAETAFHTLQHSHSQSQEELRSLATELQNRTQNLQGIETRNKCLEAELQRVEEEKTCLKELNLSSAMSIENLQDDILSLRETLAKLEAEVELRVDQRNVLQQEIYCLKEELNNFNKRHQDMTGQLESVGLNLENFVSSVKELQDENGKLKDDCERDKDEKLYLLEKLKIMEKLIEKNALLESSLSDLNVELESVRGRVKTLEESCHSLLGEKSTLAAEKDTLISQLHITTENLVKLSEKNNFLENSCTLHGEPENIAKEKNSLQELKVRSAQFSELQSRAEKLADMNEELKSKVIEGGQREEVLQTEIASVHEQLLVLQREYRSSLEENRKVVDEKTSLMEKVLDLENELVLVRSVGDQLNDEVLKGKDLLEQKEIVLFETERMLSASQEERAQLHKVVEDLKTKYEEVKLIGKDQKWQILKLSGDYDHQSKETESIRQANQKSEIELSKLNEELEERKRREVQELEKGVKILERENGELKAQLAAYVPAVVSLMDSVTSLRSRTLLSPKFPTDHNEEVKDANLGTELHAENCEQTGEDRTASVPDGFSDLKSIHKRVKSIEKEVLEMQNLATMENLNLNSKLETAMRQIEELRFGSSSRRERVRAKRHVNVRQVGGKHGHGLSNGIKIQRPTPEISEEDSEIMTKDVMLDETSESSSYGISRRGTAELDNRMLELWEINDHDGNIALKVGKAQKIVTAPSGNQRIVTAKARKGKSLSTESFVKELGVDKESSKRFTEPYQEGSKRKILERLDSDAQKLANLQITVQDLKRKVEITETGKNGKGIEYGTVKQQLEEAEETVMQLFDVNRKLVTNVEDRSRSLDGKPSLESDESGSFRRRRVSEQARRGSEKLGRLQLEVQKIQFLLLNLDEKESKGRTRITERTSRVLLQDFLYGGIRKSSQKKKKKTPFCACAQPPTKGD